MISIVVVNNIKDWNINVKNVEVVPAKTYLTDTCFADVKNVRIYNLCRSYRYQSIGYYVSLLAEARGHKIFPSVSTIQDVKSQIIMRISSEDLDQLIQKSLAKIRSERFELSVYFGKNVAKQYENLSRQLYNLFPLPLFRATFVHNKKWILLNVVPMALSDIPDAHKSYAIQFAEEYFNRKQLRSLKRNATSYDLAILVNPKEAQPPSNKKAIKNFIAAAEKIGLSTELITKEDFSRLAEFDALFIRETTAVNHYTYRFAQRAAAEGLVVIDDPESIIKCTNKVYLAELMTRANISRPKTLIVHKDNKDIIGSLLGLPCVLKKPDSSFSYGVIKVENRQQLQVEVENFLAKSELIIAQEFMPTDFDWRIGVLDKKPLFACKYYMARGHWQIYNWHNTKGVDCGNYETVPLEKVPMHIIKTALKSANLIGDGFYGVDVKEHRGRAYVIEINDNPNIDAGCEDFVLHEEMYLTIMRSILQRIKIKKEKSTAV